MTEEQIATVLLEVCEGRLSPAEALEKLKLLPFAEKPGGLTIDTHRALRVGMPEVVYARNKTAMQVKSALCTLVDAHGAALATAVSLEMAHELSSGIEGGTYDECSRLFRVGNLPRKKGVGSVAVICAGASDLPVAEEAAQTLEFAGCMVQRFSDVGVAGLHRVLAKLEMLRQARVIIAVAGMEGALPSVVAGLVSSPVIAVPTSIGYGASFNGLAALLGMLNSCASGLAVVNIDNGFGAAMVALRILHDGTHPKSS